MARRSTGKTGSKHPNGPAPLLQLDYLYTPSTDVAADVEYFTGVLEPSSISRSKRWARGSRCSA